MNPIIQLFLKVFLHVVIVYTVLLLLFISIIPFDISIGQYLLMSLAVGVPLAVLFTSMQVDNLQRMGIETLTASHLSLHQSEEIWSALGLGEIESTLREKDRFKSARFSRQGKHLEVRTRSLWAFLGEKIDVWIIEADQDRIKYRIESQPVLPIVSLDYGRNLKNIAVISKWISSEW